MLKLPKGLKKKKKGKKSKRKGEDDLFTEEELEQYRREHQQAEAGAGDAKHNEEWDKFNNLTTGVDSILKKTQGDLDRIKSTSFFQRVPAGVKELKSEPKQEPSRPVVEITAADFPQFAAAAAAAAAANDDVSDAGVTDDESEEEEGDDIFDTSYVDAVERGEVKLAYVPDSPDECPQDDDIFDTSHVDALIKGQEAKSAKGKGKNLDIGLAVGVLTGRIDNVTLTTTRRKRVIPGDLLIESGDQEVTPVPATVEPEPIEKSILDTDADVPITTPIDLSVSLHTALLQQSRRNSREDISVQELTPAPQVRNEEDEFDEFTQLAAESLESNIGVIKLEEKEIKVEPVLQESWSAFEADKSESVFAECIVEDQIDVFDPYLNEDDPFDTSFAEAVIPTQLQQVKKEAVILEEDDDFDPRAEEFKAKLNNRRKSSVRIHLTDPSGVRESITSDDIIEKEEEFVPSRDLLGGSTTDLTQLGDSPLDPLNANNSEVDPFDTSIVDKIVAPGKIELKLLEEELISNTPAPVPVFRVPSDPDFDPRAEEPVKPERRASRPENLVVNKSVGFDVDGEGFLGSDKQKPPKPVTPYYSRDVSITEDINEEAAEAVDVVPETLTRTRSDENLSQQKPSYQSARRHSELPGARPALLPVLKPRAPPPRPAPPASDPFDTSFAGDIAPSKTELRLLAKEFSCEDSSPVRGPDGGPDLLEPEDDIFQVKALTPEPSDASRSVQQYDPFDTSFAGDLNPGRTELKLLESEFLN